MNVWYRPRAPWPIDTTPAWDDFIRQVRGSLLALSDCHWIVPGTHPEDTLNRPLWVDTGTSPADGAFD